MNSNFSSFSRRGPDNVTEELVAVLSSPKSYEFKALFLVVHEALRARNAASGGEEMLRLRAYEKLQNLVGQGQVKKTGKQYKGVRKSILILAESLRDLRKNGPSFTPRPPFPVKKSGPVEVEKKAVKVVKAVKVKKIASPRTARAAAV